MELRYFFSHHAAEKKEGEWRVDCGVRVYIFSQQHPHIFAAVRQGHLVPQHAEDVAAALEFISSVVEQRSLEETGGVPDGADLEGTHRKPWPICPYFENFSSISMVPYILRPLLFPTDSE